jgi:hypothetical protein
VFGSQDGSGWMLVKTVAAVNGCPLGVANDLSSCGL